MSRRTILSAAPAALLAAGLAWGARGGELGARPDALASCDEAWDRGRLVEARQCYSALLGADSAAVRAEAWWALGDVKRANEVFREVVAAEPENPDPRVRWGYLYLETHQEGEAMNLFREALKIDPDHRAAKLGAARVASKRFEEKSRETVKELLGEEPRQVEGYLLMARMQLEEGDLEEADKSLDRALAYAEELNRSPLEAYALKASLDLLRGVTDSPWTRKALEYNPTYGQVHAEAAYFYNITRRYREAIELLRKAVEIDPELWSAHADLGVNLMRENREEEGRRHLEIAYRGDPFSAKTVNTLRLLDSFDNFKQFSNKDLLRRRREDGAAAALDAPEIIVRLHKKEAEMLRPYVLDLAERSVAEFSEKYGFTPTRPIHVELYPDHDDFAVRTLGLPGVGLLGVTFGYLVAMDSPSGRKPGEFHWGTTLWHEMAHVFTLEATDHLVPRWFSEGISMYEEWEARPNWGERITPDFIQAFHDGKLLPAVDLDKGFIRPSYPSQVAVSYFQAGLVCSMIDRRWGPEKLVDMLNAFGRDEPTARVIETTLGLEPEAFDEAFHEFLVERLGPMADKGAFERWREKLKEFAGAVEAEDWDRVAAAAPELKEIYPEYVESANPYVWAAEALDRKGDRAAAVKELEEYFRVGGRHPPRLKKLADWLYEAGRVEDSTAVLDELLYVWPNDEELHVDLGERLREAGRFEEAVREFRAALAMDPHDKAAAHFRLAETYYKMKNSEQTRRHLLYALEAAPGYRPAQKLLLETAR